MFISFNNKFSNSNIMSTNESTHILLLQYMRIITRQQDTLINTINSMQQQNENLYSLMSDLIRLQNNTSTTTRQQPRTHASTNRTRRTTINRPRTRMFFPSTLSGITERMNRTPRIVTHPPSMRVNIPGTVNQTTTTEDIINESFNNYNPISIRPSLFQIRRATRILEFRDISNTTHQICPIDREILIPSDTVMQILHCNHYFRESNLRRHFRHNTRCPLCRFDIRNYIFIRSITMYRQTIFDENGKADVGGVEEDGDAKAAALLKVELASKYSDTLLRILADVVNGTKDIMKDHFSSDAYEAIVQLIDVHKNSSSVPSAKAGAEDADETTVATKSVQN